MQQKKSLNTALKNIKGNLANNKANSSKSRWRKYSLSAYFFLSYTNCAKLYII